jgi:hypothetical protein
MPDDQINRIEDKIDTIVDKIGNIDITLAKQSIILDEHTRRSTALEAIVLPMQRKMGYAEGALKFIGLVCVVTGGITSVIYIVQFIAHFFS